MKIQHISDSHGLHSLLTIPKDIDMVIHSGDFTNYKEYIYNLPECESFLNWYEAVQVPIKILVAGNHDATAFKVGRKQFKEMCSKRGIIYLEDELYTVNNIKIYGSPVQPSFCDWYFQKSRAKLYNFWSNIPNETDILITHGPPKGVLDLSENRDRTYDRCGCSALMKHILNRLNLKFHLFGHIHNCGDIMNQGTMKLSTIDTIFSNGSVVEDRHMDRLSSNGNILIYE